MCVILNQLLIIRYCKFTAKSTALANRTKKFSQGVLDAIAARLKMLMVEGESMCAFCRRMGDLDSGNMSRYMRGKTMPTLETLMSVADVTNVTLDWLAAGVGPKYRKDAAPLPTMTITAKGAHSIAAGGNVTVNHTSPKENTN
jgi:transcriptional regulator with XRE-family HTH domain